ncbi:VCBS repeat-containing protein [bacterium]|nr:VCBS repeat-containing protein [bacterium]
MCARSRTPIICTKSGAPEQFCLAQQFPGQYVEHPRFIVDIDGDGFLDIAGFGPQGVTVAVNNGDGTFQPASVWFDGWTASQHVRLFADLNGDGFADIVGIGQRKVAVCLCEDTDGDGKGDRGVLVSLCDGADFLAPEQRLKDQFCRNSGWTSPALFPRDLVDMNGDSNGDIVGFGEDGVYVSLGVDNTGDSQADAFMPVENWFRAFGASNQPPCDPTRHLRLLGEVDGTGAPEVVVFFDDGVYVY